MAEKYVKSLAELLAKEYGVKTSYRIDPTGNTAFVNAVQQILATNPKRLGYVVVNMGAEPLFIAPNSQVSSATPYGIQLVANGGIINMVWNEDFEMVSLPWYAMSTAVGTDVFVMEIQLI